jgi:hypothetical protein
MINNMIKTIQIVAAAAADDSSSVDCYDGSIIGGENNEGSCESSSNREKENNCCCAGQDENPALLQQSSLFVEDDTAKEDNVGEVGDSFFDENSNEGIKEKRGEAECTSATASSEQEQGSELLDAPPAAPISRCSMPECFEEDFSERNDATQMNNCKLYGRCQEQSALGDLYKQSRLSRKESSPKSHQKSRNQDVNCSDMQPTICLISGATGTGKASKTIRS